MDEFKSSVRITCKIKEMAESRGVSLRKLSEEIGVGFESVRRLANNISPNFSRDLMERFCTYFECGHEDLFKTEKMPEK